MEREQVERFLAKHSSHEGLVTSLQWIQRWMDAATLRTEDVPAARELQQAAQYGITPLQMLTEAAALFLYSENRPQRLPDDDRLTWPIGARVLTMGPRERRFGRLHGKPASF